MLRSLPLFSLLLAVVLAGSSTATAQTITMPVLPQIGSGLQIGPFTVTLSTGQHGGVTLHIESADPSIARVSTALATVGTGSVDVFLPNGSTTVSLWVHAMDSITGSTTITASAPGFTGVGRTATVVTPALDLSGVLTSIDTLDPADAFAVRVGVPNGGGTALIAQQVVRAGSSLTATVNNSNATFGQLVTNTITGQSVTVTIAGGQSQSPASVASGGVAFDGIAVGTTTVSATIPDFTPTTGAAALVNVTQPIITMPSISNVGAGLMTNAQASLSASAHGGITVHLESSNPAAVLLSPDTSTPGGTAIDLFIGDGSTTVSFFVHGIENVVSASDIILSAPAFAGVSRQCAVLQPALDMIGLLNTIDTLDPIDPFQVRIGLANAGNTGLIATQAVRAGSPGHTASIMSLTPSVGTLVTSTETDDTVQVSIAAGQSLSPSTVVAGGAAFDGLSAGSTAVLAQIPGFITTSTGSVNVTVTSPTISWTSLSTVGAGLMVGQPTATLSASQHGGVTVHVQSADSTRVLISPSLNVAGTRSFDVFLANGSTAISVFLHGVEGAVGTSDITISAPGFTSTTRTASVVQPGLDLIGFLTTIDTIDPDDAFQVRLGVPNAGSTAIIAVQPVRTGSPGVTATVISSLASVATLTTTPLTDDTVTVNISAGSSISPASVAAGGVALHPVAAGSTTVSASIPNFITTTNGHANVTVTQPTIAVNAIGEVGAGLQGAVNSATLSAGQHGGVTVRVESSNPAVALVSTNSTTAGSAFFTSFVANGSTNVQFVVHGVENVTGTASIVVSTPDFSSGSTLATILQPGVDMINLASAMDVDDPDDPFQVRVGLKNAGNTQVVTPQPVRAGSPGMTITLVSSSPAVGLLMKAAATDDTVLVTLPAGQFATPATVAAGGVAFSGVGVGNTLVTARIPNVFPTGNASISIDVTDMALVMAPIGKVGAGLQSSSQTATIGFANHGGVTVRIESASPSVALVSPNFSTPGTAFFETFVVNGVTTVPFFVQGVEGAAASATINATSTGFANAARVADIVPPGVQIEQLEDSLDVNDADDPFIVRIGVPKSDLTAIELPQVVRAGGTAKTATVSHSNAGIADLVTNLLIDESVTVSIPVGQSQSGADVASGGVALDPLLAGTTVVSASVPGAATLAASAATCVLTGVPNPTGAGAIPRALALDQNIPNPFNPTTRIRFALPAAAHVTLFVYDVRGRLVATLVDRLMPAGTADVLWNGRDDRGAAASSGVYFYRLAAGARTLTKKMVLLK